MGRAPGRKGDLFGQKKGGRPYENTFGALQEEKGGKKTLVCKEKGKQKYSSAVLLLVRGNILLTKLKYKEGLFLVKCLGVFYCTKCSRNIPQ